MIAVLFEAWLDPAMAQRYLDLAESLRGRLANMDGFVSVERFRSLTDPDKMLSLSVWEDEAAVARWRRVEEHREAQSAGRASIFREYRLRIAAVMRDYGMHDRAQAPDETG